MIYRSVELQGYDYSWLWIVALVGVFLSVCAGGFTFSATKKNTYANVALVFGLILSGLVVIISLGFADNKSEEWDHNQRVAALEKLELHYVAVNGNSFTAEGNDAVFMAGEFVQLNDADKVPNQWHIILTRGAGTRGGAS